MKKKVLWMLAAILTCGLTMTSCFTEDNPVGSAVRAQADSYVAPYNFIE